MMPATSSAWAVSIVLGLILAGGVALVLARVPRWGAPSLSKRIAPYLRDVADPAALAGLRLRREAALDLHSLLRAALRHAGGVSMGAGTTAKRLRHAGRRVDPDAFRARRLGWAVGGLGIGAVGAIALAISGAGSPATWILPVIGAAGAALGFDVALAGAARARQERIQEELPTVLEFLALCLSAGEGILDALRRVSVVGAGELSAELRALVVDVGTGTPLPSALTRLSAELEIGALSRAIDQLVAAIERGAPLAAVLHSQATDAREEAKRSLIERAGRKEIWMLFPLVFLILPMSVLFAVYPGIFMLRLGLG